VTSSVHRTQSLCYFLHQFSVITHKWQEHEKKQINLTSSCYLLKCWTLMFQFSTYCQSSLKHFCHLSTKTSTAAVMALVVATTCRPSRSLSTMLSLLRANFVHQTCIAGLVKHLSPYTGCISEWISCALSRFADKRTNNSSLFFMGWLQQQRRHI